MQMATKLSSGHFRSERARPDTRNEGTFTSHFQTEKGWDTRAATSEMLPAIIREEPLLLLSSELVAVVRGLVGVAASEPSRGHSTI